MTGLYVCRAVRADAATAATAILIVSAYGFTGDIEAGRAAGADDDLVKRSAEASCWPVPRLCLLRDAESNPQARHSRCP